MPTSNKLSVSKGFVRMSWAPENLFNLHRLSYNPAQHISQSLSFKRTPLTLFQQKWASKKLLRAYHGDWIQERVFRRRFLPSSLPPLQQKESTTMNSSRTDANERIPLGSLMWREVEARLDVLVFRSCFAHSVYEARRLVTQGHVSLNGKKERDPGILLAPGDILSVDPTEMYLLRESDAPFSTQKSGGKEEAAAAAEDEADAATAPEEPAVPASSAEGESSAAETAASTSTDAAAAAAAAAAKEATTGSAETETTKPTAEPTTTTSSKPSKRSTSLKTMSPKKEIPGRPFSLPDYAAPFLFIPAYLEVSFATCSSIYVRHPTARPGYSEIPTPVDADGETMRLTWEYYKNVGRRRRDLEDWGEDLSKRSSSSSAAAASASSTAPAAAPSIRENRVQHFDKNGKRIWAAVFPERVMELRRLRGVRTGRGRWAHRPT